MEKTRLGMTILLLNPPKPSLAFRGEVIVHAPLAACLTTGYIAASLQSRGLPVEVIEADLELWGCEETAAALREEKTFLLGVHLVYLWEETFQVLNLLKGLKEEGVATHLNLYGYYPTFAYEELLSSFPFVDSVTVGEPEFTFLELAQRLKTGKEWQNVQGLAWIERRTVRCNPARPLIDPLDQLPLPLRPSPELARRKGITNYLLGSRGCTNHCSFCYLTPFYQGLRRWRGRSPDNIVAEMSRVLKETGLPDFYFADGNFFGPGQRGQRRAQELVKCIREQGLSVHFGLECCACDVQEETLSRLQEAGLTHLFIGIESGSEETLQCLRKNITVDINERAIGIARRLGLKLSTGFILFEPDARLERVRESFEFLQRMDLLHTPSITAHLLHHSLVPLRGTEVFNRLASLGRLEVKSFTDYEGKSRFVDSRVEALAELMQEVCLKVLRNNRNGDYDSQENCYCIPKNGEGEKSLRLNTLVIDVFSRALETLERSQREAVYIEELKGLKAQALKELGNYGIGIIILPQRHKDHRD